MAFKACFGDIKIVNINIRSDFDHYNDLLVDVKIIDDDKVEQLIAPDKVPDMMELYSEITDKVPPPLPGWPLAADEAPLPSPAPAKSSKGDHHEGRFRRANRVRGRPPSDFCVCRS